MFLEYVD